MDTLAALKNALVPLLSQRWIGLACSGGTDSVALVHAFAQVSDTAARRRCFVLHVDHRLQAAAPDFAERSQTLAWECGIAWTRLSPLRNIDGHSVGIESAARAARYACFDQWAQGFAERPCVVLAHHADDQLETFFLRLLRGAGSIGIAGMRAHSARAQFDLLRPWLAFKKSELRDYADAHQLPSVEDPMNADRAFLRSRLRHELLPTLTQINPNLSGHIRTLSEQWHHERDLLARMSEQALAQCLTLDEKVLSLSHWRKQEPALQPLILRRWLESLGRKELAFLREVERLSQSERDAGQARLGQAPGRYVVHRYQDALWFEDIEQRSQALSKTALMVDQTWLALPNQLGLLRLEGSEQAHAFLLATRLGGERILLNGTHRALKDYFNQIHIPPWLRDQVPLLFDSKGQLLAALGVVQSDELAQWAKTKGVRLHFQRRQKSAIDAG